ncbi:TPA: hypothetical protein SMM89_002978 [Proteus mirabilis]|uniref:DUF7167 family protein n=2 Tax=Proteus mirabilis TaxID=584 RepID=UPI000AAC77CD|nr:hypothetical protein [Proteus mirabilis]EKT9733238.1 hypothetical protein [Proteus mirabilis]EKU7612948.1 hypothetical protein [Proteus mirabilis]EKW3344249.1 hypothetical protein [Proteus mirabilis]EKW4128422.1 hypothetical protein [Proteus mirabilis]EKW6742307.1 hypothetical protein [Proteus mirabilis]
MSKQMYLHASTNNIGSECKTELDITEDEWNKLTEKEQDQLIGEFMSDVCDWWVQPEE